MRFKKLLFPAIIMAVAVLAIAVYSVVSSIALKPTVTEGEFPFSITYELNGERVTIEDVYTVRYTGDAGYAQGKTRSYIGKIGDMPDDTTFYTIQRDEDGRIELFTNFYPDDMMGDATYDYYDEGAVAPQLYYYDLEEVEYIDEETLAAQGAKIISWEYPEPIENTLVFSHISYCDSEVVLPSLLIMLLVLIIIIIFVKKEHGLRYKVWDRISIILNFVTALTLVPFVTFLAMLIDLTGGGAEFYYQIMYFIPALSMAAIAASVALRRKGYGVKSLITCLVGPAFFGLYLLVCGICGLL